MCSWILINTSQVQCHPPSPIIYEPNTSQARSVLDQILSKRSQWQVTSTAICWKTTHKIKKHRAWQRFYSTEWGRSPHRVHASSLIPEFDGYPLQHISLQYILPVKPYVNMAIEEGRSKHNSLFNAMDWESENSLLAFPSLDRCVRVCSGFNRRA